MTPTIDSPKKLAEFGVVSIIASAACAFVISWGSESLKMIPFSTLATIIALNNTVMSMILGPLFLPFLYRRMKKLGLIWTTIMDRSDIFESKYPQFYSLLVAIGAVGGLAAGLLISLFTEQTFLSSYMEPGTSGRLIVELGTLPFLAVLIFGATKL